MVRLLEIKKYIKIDTAKYQYEEKDLNAVSIKESKNYSDESLEVEQI